MPLGWRRWAHNVLTPKVDYMAIIRQTVRTALRESTLGRYDRTYRRPHRRQACYGEFIMPSFYQPRPRPGFLIDTSSSMQNAQLARAVAELGGLTRQLGYAGEVVVACCDAAVHDVRKVFNAAQLQIYGGGGTESASGWSGSSAEERPDRSADRGHRLPDGVAAGGAAVSGDHHSRRRRPAAAWGDRGANKVITIEDRRPSSRRRARVESTRHGARATSEISRGSAHADIPPDSVLAWLRLGLWEFWMGMLVCGFISFGALLIVTSPDRIITAEDLSCCYTATVVRPCERIVYRTGAMNAAFSAALRRVDDRGGALVPVGAMECGQSRNRSPMTFSGCSTIRSAEELARSAHVAMVTPAVGLRIHGDRCAVDGRDRRHDLDVCVVLATREGAGAQRRNHPQIQTGPVTCPRANPLPDARKSPRSRRGSPPLRPASIQATSTRSPTPSRRTRARCSRAIAIRSALRRCSWCRCQSIASSRRRISATHRIRTSSA